jgi:hypothetical protein
MWGVPLLIAPILLEGWWDMRRLSLCCSIGLGVVFDPRSHTRHPPYELMSRNWYVSFCWSWYQEKRGPWRSISDEKSKTIPVPGGALYLHFELSPRHISPYYPQNSAYTDWSCPGGHVCSIPCGLAPRIPSLKVPLFLRHWFSRKRDKQSRFKLYMTEGGLPIYLMIIMVPGLPEWISNFGGNPISRCFCALYGHSRRIQYKNGFLWISLDRYKLFSASCEIWRLVIHLGLEDCDN